MKKKKIVVVFVFCFMLLFAVFMGKGEAQAAGNYSIQINKATNVVTVFRNDGTPVKAFVCSTGTATPIGTFYTSQKLRWHVLDGPSYGQYCTRITGSILFHSVWYYGNGDYASQSYREYNKLGTTASHGCVRLTVADAKWIYDNCSLQTKVTVIWGSSANDPLGKPEAIKIPPSYGSRGWDPTDPMSGNPYSGLRPSIDVSAVQTQLTYGAPFNAYAGVVARDSLGNDITHKLSCSGAVNTSQFGSYRMSYAVTDALGRSAYADVVYTVVDTQPATLTGVVGSQTKEYNSVLKLRANVKAYTVDQKNLTDQIRIKIVYPKSKTEKLYNGSTLKLNKLGTYIINYYVINPNNGMETKATGTVLVRDTKKPKLTGVAKKKTLEYNSVRNLKKGVKAKLVSGKSVYSKIVIKIKVPKGKKYIKLSEKTYKKYKFKKLGTYRVEYSVANPYNKKAVAKKVTVITVKDTKKPKLSGISSKKNKEYKSVLNLRSGVTAKLVSGKNMTSKIVVKVKAPGAKKYKTLSTNSSKKYCFTKVGGYSVEYSVANPYNKKAVAKKVMKVTVKDTKAPVISGVNDQAAALGESLDLRAGVKAKLLSGKDITDQLTIEVTTPENVKSKWTKKKYLFEQVGEYTVTYTAVNPEKGKQAKAVMKVTVTDERLPEIAIDPEKLAEITTGVSYEVKAGVSAVLPDQTEVEVKAEITGVDADGQSIQVPSISEDGTVVFETAGKYTIEYTAVNPNNEAKSVTKTFTLTVTLKNDEDPKPEDPKPEDPKPEDPKPEGPKPEEPQELQEGSETAETDSKNQEEDDQIVSEDLEDVQEESQNSPADLENPQQEGQDSPEDLEDLQVNLKNL
ncbi:MAG: DUF5011 domain-containing protein [Lachnospiraceae bacterium]|nr:DUF5011 domain-containing protein [Lachnospiraceae bacterium]